jgi:hypothetical protein
MVTEENSLPNIENSFLSMPVNQQLPNDSLDTRSLNCIIMTLQEIPGKTKDE